MTVHETILQRSIEAMSALDGRLGKEAKALIATDDNDAARRMLVTIASAHLECAVTLLRLARGSDLAAQVLYARADGEATRGQAYE